MKVCKKCGSSDFVPNGKYTRCKPCQNMRSAKWSTDNPEMQRARVSRWRSEHIEMVKVQSKRGHEKNKEKRNAASRVYRANNRQHMNELSRNWSKKNLDKARFSNASRRAKKNIATPVWAKNEFDVFVVKEMFHLATLRTRIMGFAWHVDHIVPLKSKIVCGLHCPVNMQIIPALVNQSKGNRNWPNMPS